MQFAEKSQSGPQRPTRIQGLLIQAQDFNKPLGGSLDGFDLIYSALRYPSEYQRLRAAIDSSQICTLPGWAVVDFRAHILQQSVTAVHHSAI